MARDEGKKVNGDKGRSERIEGELLQADMTIVKSKVLLFVMASVNPCVVPRMLGTTTHDQVSEEEMVAAFAYKMDRPWLQADELRVEMRQGNALWVISQVDETTKVKLRRNHKMRLSKAMASMSADGMLTVVIPKRFQPRKVVRV